MIVSVRDADTETLASGRRVSRFVNIEADARRTLRQLEIAGRLEDLRVPPENRLEARKRERLGHHSIRVNDPFRLCFRWTDAGPAAVGIVDDHEESESMAILKPVTSGELLLEEFFVPLELSQYRLAKEIDVPAPRIGAIAARVLAPVLRRIKPWVSTAT